MSYPFVYTKHCVAWHAASAHSDSPQVSQLAGLADIPEGQHAGGRSSAVSDPIKGLVQ